MRIMGIMGIMGIIVIIKTITIIKTILNRRKERYTDLNVFSKTRKVVLPIVIPFSNHHGVDSKIKHLLLITINNF